MNRHDEKARSLVRDLYWCAVDILAPVPDDADEIPPALKEKCARFVDGTYAHIAAALREAAREAYEDAASYHDDQAKRCESITDTTAPRQLLGYLAKRDQALHELAAADIRARIKT